MEKSKNENEISAELGINIEDYRTYLSSEINFIESRSGAFENKHHVENTYTIEKEFIGFNLRELQKFMGIGNIKPIGKYSSEIMSDILYRSIPNISKDIVGSIMSYYKIIDIKDVHDKFSSSMQPLSPSSRTSLPDLTCHCESCKKFDAA